MTNLLVFLEQNTETWLAVSLASAVFLFLLVVVLWINLLSFKKKFKQLMRGAAGENIEHLLQEHVAEVSAHRQLAEEIKTRMTVMEENLRQCVQYVGIKRYNAFEELGSRLSFSIAFLDDHLNGIILTGIYGRHESTTYSKMIHHGHSEQHLSVEEMDALQMAKEQQKTRKKP